MNAKAAKAVRKLVDRTGKSWDDVKYTESEHPREKTHQKGYMIKVKNKPMQVFAKVCTMKLSEDCGRSYYKLFKKALVV